MSYEALSELLQSAGEVVQLPELHGGICGALAAGGPKAAELWLDESLDEPASDADASQEADETNVLAEERLPALGAWLQSLHAIVTASWQALEARELAFEPLLPDEEALLEEQVQALALWCHGFLSGLGFSAPEVGGSVRDEPAAGSAETATIGEILGDFAEIARAGVTEDDSADIDEAEFALAELKEYVRISVQIVFEELSARRAAVARDVH